MAHPVPAFVPLIAPAGGNRDPDDIDVSALPVHESLSSASALRGPPPPEAPRRPGGAVGRLLRVGAPAAGGPPRSFPPLFDSRLWYRAAHQPYEIQDQDDCASCVFIAAASVAQVRAAIGELEGDGASAAAVWRKLLAEAGGGEDGYRAAVGEFVRLMVGRAEQAGEAAPVVPPLDWRRFICCEASSCDPSADCYHHQDGDPKDAAFSCSKHSEGVVPHHFVEWVAGIGFHARGSSGSRIVRTIEPERRGGSPRFALVEPLQVASVDARAAGRVADQVRRIKASLMAHGPVMAMMRIEGDGFDTWGAGSRAGKMRRRTRRAAREGQGEGDNGDDGDDDGPPLNPPAHLAPRAGASAGSRGSEENGEEEESAVAVDPSMRVGYRLPAADRFDEYHEVMVLGWGLDDAGAPCWIIQNSYGASYNSHCAIDPTRHKDREPWLAAPLGRLHQAYRASGLTAKRGCMFVEMVNADLVQARRNTDLENNVIAFLPVLDSGPYAEWVAAGRAGAARSGAAGLSEPLALGGAVVLVLAVAIAVLAVRYGRGSTGAAGGSAGEPAAADAQSRV